jgi:hypothetical protein
MVSEATLIAKAVGVMIWDVRECGVGGYSDTVDGKQLVASICGRGERVAYRWGREKLIIVACLLSVLRMLLVYQAYTGRNTARILGRQKVTHCSRIAPQAVHSFADTEHMLSV